MDLIGSLKERILEGCKDGLTPAQCYEMLVMICGNPWQACKSLAMHGDHPGKDIAEMDAMLRKWASKQWET